MQRQLFEIPSAGLFQFDSTYRPVPLQMTFVGVSVSNFAARNMLMTEICYNKVRLCISCSWLDN
jgi:hypothetical protein